MFTKHREPITGHDFDAHLRFAQETAKRRRERQLCAKDETRSAVLSAKGIADEGQIVGDLATRDQHERRLHRLSHGDRINPFDIEMAVANAEPTRRAKGKTIGLILEAEHGGLRM